MYDRRIGNRELTFGISGRLYKRNVLLYDLQTESLWSQVQKQSVTGELTGTPLEVLPALETRWSEWKSKHPNTLVLSDRTGYERDYLGAPYAGLRFEDKVIGIEIAGQTKAYPFVELKKASNKFTDMIGGRAITIRYEPKNNSAMAVDSNGDLVPFMIVAREAWLQFHPESTLFQAGRKR